MRNLFTSLFTVLSLCSLGQGASSDYIRMIETYYSDFPTITAKEVIQLKKQQDVYFLDTREPEEFKISHLENALNIGFSNPKWELLRSIPTNAKIVVYCSVGARSQQIGEQLKAKGYNQVTNLYGGIFYWFNTGYPVYNTRHQETLEIHGFDTEWGKWIKRGKVRYGE
jgi:rhodanese-related sulfurtransferase